MALGLSLLTGACGVPVAITAASYGADGALMAKTHKTSTDHFASMVTKEDCSLWRIFKHQKVCKPRETDHDPYQVNYDEPFRMQAEGQGVSYGPPLHAASDAPVTAWEASAYQTAPPSTEKPGANAPQTAGVSHQPLEAPVSPEPTTAMATPAPKPVATATHVAPAKSKKKVAKAKPKKVSPSQVASAH